MPHLGPWVWRHVGLWSLNLYATLVTIQLGTKLGYDLSSPSGKLFLLQAQALSLHNPALKEPKSLAFQCKLPCTPAIVLIFSFLIAVISMSPCSEWYLEKADADVNQDLEGAGC